MGETFQWPSQTLKLTQDWLAERIQSIIQVIGIIRKDQDIKAKQIKSQSGLVSALELIQSLVFMVSKLKEQVSDLTEIMKGRFDMKKFQEVFKQIKEERKIEQQIIDSTKSFIDSKIATIEEDKKEALF